MTIITAESFSEISTLCPQNTHYIKQLLTLNNIIFFPQLNIAYTQITWLVPPFTLVEGSNMPQPKYVKHNTTLFNDDVIIKHHRFDHNNLVQL